MDIKNYYQNLPKKRISAGALIFDEQGRLLIVKPTYKDHWSLPGGVADENESPRQACLREVKEETGLSLGQLEFICVDYFYPKEEKSEALHFIFSGGILQPGQIENIKIPKDEISEYRFVEINEASRLLSENFKTRLPKCLEALQKGQAIYLEAGK
ncbi:MAG: NUDIX hydrolase [Patescibacteria group bacterium]|nr:NUDIX hydrolase [Patescibacteria group bacterium]